MEDKLTKDRQQDLIEIMYKEEMRIYSEIGYNPRKTIVFPSDMNEAWIHEKIDILGKTYSSSIESARGILSPSQHEQYENYLKNKQEILEMSLKLLNQ